MMYTTTYSHGAAVVTNATGKGDVHLLGFVWTLEYLSYALLSSFRTPSRTPILYQLQDLPGYKTKHICTDLKDRSCRC